MPKSTLLLPTLAVFFVTFLSGVASWNSPDTIVPLQQATATALPEITPTEDSWIIVDLPPDSTQLQYGAEVYRLVCKACHGDKGQGLTDDWRAQWAPSDQNCWQSKCHAANHPPDGFYMPMSPAVVGPPLVMFDTALDLYNYIHDYMPWHDRGSMTQKESWSVTAYILKINNVDPGPDLSPMTASQIRLRSNSAPTAAAAPAAATNAGSVHRFEDKKTNKVSPIWIVATIATLLLVFVGLFTLGRRSTH
jgi:cytochrome c5